MNCQSAEELLLRSLDLRLSSAERARLDAHLDACRDCRTTAEEYRRLTRAAIPWAGRAAPTDLTDAEFTDRVMAQIARTPSPAGLRRPLLAAGLLAVVLAALSLAVSPWLPPLPPWRLPWDWSAPVGFWSEAQAMLPARWAALAVVPALAVNAILWQRARRRA